MRGRKRLPAFREGEGGGDNAVARGIRAAGCKAKKPASGPPEPEREVRRSADAGSMRDSRHAAGTHWGSYNVAECRGIHSRRMGVTSWLWEVSARYVARSGGGTALRRLCFVGYVSAAIRGPHERTMRMHQGGLPIQRGTVEVFDHGDREADDRVPERDVEAGVEAFEGRGQGAHISFGVRRSCRGIRSRPSVGYCCGR